MPNNNSIELSGIVDALQTIIATINDIEITINSPPEEPPEEDSTVTYMQLGDEDLTASLIIKKADVALSTFDFSEESHYGSKIFKTKAYALTDSYSIFGVNENYWEYAWEFNGNEDFCWKHGTTGKQFSITKEGATAKNLFIADFITNSTDGRHVVNEIDVKATLASLDSEINTAQQNISDIQTAIALVPINQIFYSGTAPISADLNNGDIWFDNINLRLNVRHSNAWINPDRNDGANLEDRITALEARIAQLESN